MPIFQECRDVRFLKMEFEVVQALPRFVKDEKRTVGAIAMNVIGKAAGFAAGGATIEIRRSSSASASPGFARALPTSE